MDGSNRILNVLVACEESQRVCIEFLKRGHNAFSCDIQEPSGGRTDRHILGDVLKVLQWGRFSTMDGAEHSVEKWDLIIAHPPCTYLSNAGARWLWANQKLNKERYQQGLKAKEFFMHFLSADCEHIAVENPIPTRIFGLPKYTQIIQPYEYGHPYTKKTCLWLKGLPLLKPTEIIEEHKPFVSSGSYSKTHDPKYKGASRKGGSAKSRSKTFPGIAKAMAQQWGKYLCELHENS